MRGRLIPVGVTVLLGALMPTALLDCVGDTPAMTDSGADSGNAGKLGGPCYGNGTCDSPLICAGGYVCIAPDGGGTDAMSVDGGSEGGEAADCGTVPADAGVRCPGSRDCTSAVERCCVTNGVGTCTTGACMSDFNWSCDSRANCNGGTSCCAPNATITPSCPAKVTGPSYAWCPGGPCPMGQTTLCITSADCPVATPKCIAATFDAGGPKIVGVCVQ